MVKYLKWIIAGIFLPVITYLLMALILSVIGTSPRRVHCPEKEEIFVATNGVHLSLILPTGLVDEQFRRQLKTPARTTYVSFGWGDREFYLNTPTWADLKLQTALNALFMKSKTAVHVTNYQQPRPSWRKVAVCPAQVDSLNHYIINSFEGGKESTLTEIPGSGYGAHDTFYEAAGNYTFLYTCNSWVNEGLKRSQIKTSLWSPFDRGVLYHLGR